MTFIEVINFCQCGIIHNLNAVLWFWKIWIWDAQNWLSRDTIFPMIIAVSTKQTGTHAHTYWHIILVTYPWSFKYVGRYFPVSCFLVRALDSHLACHVIWGCLLELMPVFWQPLSHIYQHQTQFLKSLWIKVLANKISNYIHKKHSVMYVIAHTSGNPLDLHRVNIPTNFKGSL